MASSVMLKDLKGTMEKCLDALKFATQGLQKYEQQLADKDAEIARLKRQVKVYSRVIGRKSIGRHSTTMMQLAVEMQNVLDDEKKIAELQELVDAFMKCKPETLGWKRNDNGEFEEFSYIKRIAEILGLEVKDE
jgi:Na+/phosphate symporter